MDTVPATYRPDPLWACADCYVALANGEWPDAITWGDDAKARTEEVRAGLARFAPHALSIGRFHGVDGCGTDHADDHDAMTECETVTFSWSSCDVCRSPLGGDRYAVTDHTDPDPDPVVECLECGGPVDAGDGVAVDGLGAFCGGFYGNGCGEKYA